MKSNDLTIESQDISLAARYPLRILVAEDGRLTRHLFPAILRRFGYAPLTAKNGLEAVEIYKKNPVDCIFIDLCMPKMDGLEAITIIRDMEYVSGCKHRVFILAVTDDPAGADKQDCLDAGANDYLFKPLRHFALIKKLIEASQFTVQ